MASPEQFARNVKAMADRLQGNVDKVVRKAALAADQAVVLATPVDTGRARSNWIVEMDQPSSEVVDSLTGVSKGHRGTGTAVAQASIDKARAKIATYGPGHREIHITNNLPYISALNAGSSAQAPAGFVRKAITAAVSAIKGVKVL